MSTEIWQLDITQTAELLKAGKISPVDLVKVYLDRIESINPHIDAFLTVTADLALKQAKEAEAEINAGRWRGMLHGIPFGLKDLFNTAGVRTTAHSRVLANNVPATDATVVTRLYEAGAVLLGKMATHEFAHGGPSFDLPWPPARNPWNTDHFTGGSSSGSAAAVAAGLLPAALGTDTGGSIRSPSWLCGTVGLKPTFGRVSRAGVIPFSENCDHAGPITWTVGDSAIMLKAMEGQDPRDRSTVNCTPLNLASLDSGVKGMKLGFVRHFSEQDQKTDPELCKALDDALQVFRDLGATVEDVKLRPLSNYYAIRLMITESDLFSLHLKQFQRDPGVYGHHFLSRCLPACLFNAADYVGAQRERNKVLLEMQSVYSKYDALVTVGAGPAPKLSDHKSIGGADKWLKPNLGALASITGAPALALCCGFSSSGLPLGMQVIGRPWEDDLVLRLGHAYETHTPWRSSKAVVTPREKISFGNGSHAGGVVKVDESLRSVVETAAARAGLKLNEENLALLLEAAPYALELAARIPREFEYTDEMATVFHAH